jgi:chromosomal replication initiator protein
VLGPSNCVAFTAAQRVLQNLGQVSPLLVHGPTGTGKTHLLEGVAHAARQLRGVKRVVLMSSEQFTSYFLEALQGSGLPNFRRKYRDVDVLLIDDVQFFSGKRATLVELKHTVDTLLRDRRQLVFAADRPLAEISGLGPELLARISGGLVCRLEPPEEETRLRLVRHLAQRRHFAAPDEVLQLIARRVSGDVRQLGGALNRLQATVEALPQPLTPELAESTLADVFRSATRIVRLPDIETAVCDVFGIDVRSLQSHRKSKTLAQPRMLAMWLARKFTRAAFSEIGEYFGRRSHSTVISAQKKVDHWLVGGGKVQLGPGDCDVRDALRRVEARLQTG